MLIDSRVTFLHIAEQQQLEPYQADIAKLFEECFQNVLDIRVWKWAYIDNPLGNALVNLAFLDDKLVGHYAFIPLATTQHRVLLSMTTMVSPVARKYNTFFDLAQKSYDFAKKMDYEFIVGFPNAKSAPVHEKLLDWKIIKTFVVNCSSNKIKKDFPFSTNQRLCMLDINHGDFINWRLSKPNTTYYRKINTLYKPYNDTIDILTQRDDIGAFDVFSNHTINFLTSHNQLEQYKIFDYPFAIKRLKSKHTPDFYPELLMSDVF